MDPSTTVKSLDGALTAKPSLASSRDEPERANEMRKYLTFRLNVQVNVDLAACLRVGVLLVYLFT